MWSFFRQAFARRRFNTWRRFCVNAYRIVQKSVDVLTNTTQHNTTQHNTAQHKSSRGVLRCVSFMCCRFDVAPNCVYAKHRENEMQNLLKVFFPANRCRQQKKRPHCQKQRCWCVGKILVCCSYCFCVAASSSKIQREPH